MHADGLIYADADSCSGCCLNHSQDCDGWRKAKKRNRRTASMKPKRKPADVATTTKE